MKSALEFIEIRFWDLMIRFLTESEVPKKFISYWVGIKQSKLHR